MIDGTYQQMLSDKSSTNEKNDNIEATKKDIFSKFGQRRGDDVEYYYSNINEFKNIFRRNFTEAYAKYKPKLEEVFKRFDAVIKKQLPKKRGRQKLGFTEKIENYANLESLSQNQLKDLTSLLEEYKKNLSGGGKDRLRKVIGQQNLKKLTIILKNSIKDSNVSVQDFFKDRVIFNKALIVIGIENIEGIVYAKKVGDFKKFTANSNKFKSKNKIK